ncbi:MAG: 16S rRNA (cytosine(1402)-N(4))-methyltransferase RsmH, partial [Chitinivibrionales bacterium]
MSLSRGKRERTRVTVSDYHNPVMTEEVIDNLRVLKQGVYVDCTLGGGGHFSRIISLLNEDGIAVGLDRDLDSIELVRKKTWGTGPRVIVERSRFSDMGMTLERLGIDKIDGLLLDLGVSSWQIDEAERGFTYRQDCVLDMRMDREQEFTAADLINSSDTSELASILSEYGEVRNPVRMAEAIKTGEGDIRRVK